MSNNPKARSDDVDPTEDALKAAHEKIKAFAASVAPHVTPCKFITADIKSVNPMESTQ